MKLNFKVRIKNPTFWVNLGVSCMVVILAHIGVNWQDINTWPEFLRILKTAALNPVITVAVLGNIYNAMHDPTTKGLRDSERAMNYEKPAE